MISLGDAMEKMAVSKGRLRVAKSRKGRRPMSVTTYLRKEKEGTLYKEADTPSYIRDRIDSVEDATGVRVGELKRRQIPATVASKAREGLKELKGFFSKKASVSEQVAAEHRDRQKTASYTEKMPWYTAGVGAASGDIIGRKLLKKRPVAGALLGTLAGTGIGLEGGTAVAKKLDSRAAKTAGALKPGRGKKNSEGFKLQGRMDVQGLPIAIENRRGSVREGENDDGSKWRTKFKVPYGYIEGTKGKDGEEIDAYVGPDKEAPKAFVVQQHKDDGKGHDEDTVMLGFPSKAKAEKAFLDHYDDPKYKGKVITMGVKKLKSMLDEKPEQKKLANSMGTMARIPLGGASRGPGQTMETHEPTGKSADPKKKHGDAPTADSASHPVSTEMYPWNQSLDIAAKTAGIGHLVPRKDEFPTSSEMNVRDRVEQQSRSRSGIQWAGATHPVPGYNPNTDDKQVAKIAAREVSSIVGRIAPSVFRVGKGAA